MIRDQLTETFWRIAEGCWSERPALESSSVETIWRRCWLISLVPWTAQESGKRCSYPYAESWTGWSWVELKYWNWQLNRWENRNNLNSAHLCFLCPNDVHVKDPKRIIPVRLLVRIGKVPEVGECVLQVQGQCELKIIPERAQFRSFDFLGHFVHGPSP